MPFGWVKALLRRVAPAEQADDAIGDLEESHRRRLARGSALSARIRTSVEALDLAVGLYRERRRVARAGRARRGRKHSRVGLRTGVSWLDVKLGVRMLVRHPGITVVAGLALAVAIGLSAAWYDFSKSWTDPVLPLPHGDRVVGIQSWGIVPASERFATLEEFARWRDQLRTVELLGAFANLRSTMVLEDGRAESVSGVEMSATGFALAGVAPVLGRPLIAADELPGAPPVVVLGYGQWTGLFDGDPGVVGRTVQLGDTRATVVGVMPEGFRFPENNDAWVPLRADAGEVQRRPGPLVRVFGRIAPGVTVTEAQAELVAIDARTPRRADAASRVQPRIIPYAQLFLAGDGDAAILTLLHGALAVLLGVVCANVAALVFARTAARANEIAVRTALGASRRRILLQLFAESLVLTSAAATLGIAAAGLALRSIIRRAERMEGLLPFWLDDRIAPETLLYAAALAIIAAAIIGIVPALKATGRTVQGRLRTMGAGGTDMRFGGAWTAIVVFQVALTCALLPMALTGVRDAVRIAATPTTPAGDRTLVGFVRPEDRGPAGAPPSAEQRTAVAREEMRRRLAAEPGVAAVTFALDLPGTDHRSVRYEVEHDGLTERDVVAQQASTTWIAPDYFEAFAAPLIAGRTFRSDDDGAAGYAIVNASFVRDVLRGQNAVGRRIREVNAVGGANGPWLEIVGVAPDLGMTPGNPTRAAGVYRPLPAARAAWLVVRVNGDAATFTPRLRAIVAAADPGMQIDDVQTLDAAARRFRTGAWLRTALVGLVSATTFVLAAAGIFSLMSFTVTQRTREIGIRTALGAAPRRIVRETFARAALQLSIGLAAGSVLTFLPDYPGERVIAVAAVPLFIALVGLVACAIPVRRALRIEPTAAMREG